jgi:NAD(P)-dependent dehydrogenase (short-subunit alcohol dehydrogenase family)
MQGKTIVLTGGAGNLGRAVIARLLADGANVVALDRHGPALAALKGVQTIAVADLADEAECASAFSSIAATYARIDGVIHTVGGFAWASLADSGPALFEQQFRMNVLTTLNVLRAAIAHMRVANRGSIVAVGAGAALRAPPGMAAYAAAKSAVHRMVESFADELKDQHIRVNAVLPSTMDTPQNRADMPDADPAKWTKTSEVAETIAFLLSDAASGITGALIPVPGRS